MPCPSNATVTSVSPRCSRALTTTPSPKWSCLTRSPGWYSTWDAPQPWAPASRPPPSPSAVPSRPDCSAYPCTRDRVTTDSGSSARNLDAIPATLLPRRFRRNERNMYRCFTGACHADVAQASFLLQLGGVLHRTRVRQQSLFHAEHENGVEFQPFAWWSVISVIASPRPLASSRASTSDTKATFCKKSPSSSRASAPRSQKTAQPRTARMNPAVPSGSPCGRRRVPCPPSPTARNRCGRAQGRSVPAAVGSCSAR